MPTLEEISDAEDIDNLDMDIAEFDPSLTTPIAPARPAPQVVRSQDTNYNEPPLFPTNLDFGKNEAKIRDFQDNLGITDPSKFSEEEMTKLKSFQLLYPCYFDINRSHQQGRRVSIANAVENPLAKTISDACKELNIACLLELDKTHPQDYGNPGRVRVLIKEDGVPESTYAKNKRHLMNQIGRYLKRNPTTLSKLSEIPFPPDLQNYQPEKLPKVEGFKMNTIVPVHSPLNMKHPMTRSLYDKEANKPIAPPSHSSNMEKKKIIKVRR